VSAPDAAEERALRAEHDALAERLAVRRSIDEARKAAYAGFGAFIAIGFAAALAWDRWVSEKATRFVGPPAYFLAAAAVAAALVLATALWRRRALRLMRDEDAAFARFRELRARLGIDR
jgi:hypothetical protein